MFVSINKSSNFIVLNEEKNKFSKKCPKCKSKNVIEEDDGINKMFMIKSGNLYELWYCDDCGYDFGVLLIPEN